MMEPDAPCQRTLDELWEMLDQECDAASSTRLQAHLAACQRCYPHVDFQRAYRSFLAEHCRQDAPAELRRRVFMTLLGEGLGQA
jgi:mycothiol system anti-sigma-R factor